MAELTRREALAATALAGTGGLLFPLAATEAAADHDDKDLPNFRFNIEDQKGKELPGGSGKEATVKQLPISKGIAGVSMRLKPGGLRELHWHANAAEWAYVVKGHVRTTVLAPDGTSATDDFGPGDVWYFPRGHGHSLQGFGPEECHFILVFDNGSFSEFGTFSSTDWLAHVPRDLLAQNLGVTEADLKSLPDKEVYIVAGKVPPQRKPASRQSGDRTPANPHRYPLLAQKPHFHNEGGTEWRVTRQEFPISTTVTGAIMDLKPGALREMHWHPNANEWQYVIRGRVRISVFGSHGRARTEEFGPGDVGYVPTGFGHAIASIGDESARLLIAFDSGDYQEISLSTWLGANPALLVADNFHLPEDVVKKLPTSKRFIVPANKTRT